MDDIQTKNRVILIITITLCAFLIISLIGAYALAWTDRDPGEVWTKVFDLVSVLAGALVGYIAGQQVEKSRVPRSAPTTGVPAGPPQSQGAADVTYRDDTALDQRFTHDLGESEDSL
jgi:hypothetical protein